MLKCNRLQLGMQRWLSAQIFWLTTLLLIFFEPYTLLSHLSRLLNYLNYLQAINKLFCASFRHQNIPPQSSLQPFLASTFRQSMKLFRHSICLWSSKQYVRIPWTRFTHIINKIIYMMSSSRLNYIIVYLQR